MITANNQVVFWSRQAGGLLQSSGFLSIDEIVKLGRLNRSAQITAKDVIAYIELEITNNHGLSSGEQSSEQELKQAVDYVKKIFVGLREMIDWLRREKVNAWLEQMKARLPPGRKILEERSQMLAGLAKKGFRRAFFSKYEIMLSKMLLAIPENERLQVIMQKAGYGYGYPILFHAAEDINVFKALQNILAEDEIPQAIKHKDGKGRTILHHMATTNSIEGFNYLLDEFYSDAQLRLQAIMTRDKENKTVLHYAVEAEKADMFAYLLGLFSGAELSHVLMEEPQAINNNLVLTCAIKAGKVDVIVQRLNSLSAIELLQAMLARDKKGKTILHHTVRGKNTGLKMLNCLLGLTSSAEILQAIMQKNNEGSTVLHYIAFFTDVKKLSFVLNLLSTTEVLQAIKEKDNKGKSVIDCFRSTDISHNFSGWYLKTLAQLYTLNPSNECSQVIQMLQPIMGKEWYIDRTILETYCWQDTVAEILETLLKSLSDKNRQAAIMIKDSHNCTVFHYAAKYGDMRTLNFSLSLFPEDARPQVILQMDNEGKTVLSYAAEAGKIAVLEFLLNLFPADMCSQLMLQEKYSDGRTILHYAAEAGDVATLNYVLKLFPSNDARQQVLQEKDNKGKTVLHYAAGSGDFEIINFLLNVFDTPAKRLQALQEKDERGGTVLSYAKGYKDTFQYLQTLESYYRSTSTIERLEAITSTYWYGDNLEEENKSAMHYAAEYASRNKKIEILKYALNLFAGPELLQAILQKNDDGQTVLHYAQSVEMLELLLSLFSGTELFQAITAKNKKGVTVLSKAVTCGQVEILAYLKLLSDTERLQAIMEKDKQGRTTLHLAAMYSNVAILKELLSLLPATERSQALMEKDNKGSTVLRSCAKDKYFDIFAYRLSLTPSTERLPALMRYYDGSKTVFHCLVMHSSSKVEMVEQLLSLLSGPERVQAIQVEDGAGKTVLDYASGPNNTKIRKLLEKVLVSAKECSQEMQDDSGRNLRLSP